jgi:GNAT superfamily N-acetyltransferase
VQRPKRSGAVTRVEQVRSRRFLRRFLDVPAGIFADDPNWVAPLTFERRQHLDPRFNPFFAHAEVAFWVASVGNRPVGRVSAQIDQSAGAGNLEREGHFGFLDAIDDEAVFASLMATVEGWLAERGITRISGPFSLSINDQCGLLVDGFDSPPSVMMGHARPYYAERLQALGYSKTKELIAYHYRLDQEFPESAQRFLRKAKARENMTFRSACMGEFATEMARVVDIFNDAWAGNWGFVPFSAADMRYIGRSLKPLLRAGDVAFGEVDGDTASMAVCLPNLNEAIADLSGKLMPFGWLKLIWRLKVRGLTTARLPLMGVRRRYHGTAISTALMLGVIEAVRDEHRRRGTRSAELSWVLEDNIPMRTAIEILGGRPYKRYRIYAKKIA